MQIMLSLSTPMFYRGLQVAFDQAVHDKSHIVWLTPDREYAMRYAGDPRHLQRFTVEVNNGFNFGFRSFETEVKLSDVGDRIRTAINALGNAGKMKLATYKAITDKLNTWDGNEFRKVWVWYMEDKRVVEVLKLAGFDHVIGREGAGDNIPTIGVFDPKKVKVAL